MLPPGTSVLEQPRRLPLPARPAGRVPTGEVTAKGTAKTRAATWWDHTGPLAVVFTGGADSSAETSYSRSGCPQARAAGPALCTS